MISRLFTRVRLGHVSRTRIRSGKQVLAEQPRRQMSPAELKAMYAEVIGEALREHDA